jgi:hypothetical protein
MGVHTERLAERAKQKGPLHTMLAVQCRVLQRCYGHPDLLDTHGLKCEKEGGWAGSMG